MDAKTTAELRKIASMTFAAAKEAQRADDPRWKDMVRIVTQLDKLAYLDAPEPGTASPINGE